MACCRPTCAPHRCREAWKSRNAGRSRASSPGPSRATCTPDAHCALGPASFSDGYSGFSAAVSTAALALAALLLIAITLLRARRSWHSKRLARHEVAWSEALLRAMEVPDTDLPPIPGSLLPAFASHWNRLRASLKGPAA